MELNAAGVLAALAATVLAGHGAAEKAAGVGLAASFALASVAFARAGLPAVDALAFCIGAVVATAVARPHWRRLPPIGAGVFAAVWISILTAQGLPWLPAAAVTGCVVAATIGLAARRSGFMTAEVRDEALILVGVFALVLATGPAVLGGWRSAGALAAEPIGEAAPQIGPWLAAIVAGSVLAGGAYTAWKRR